MTWLAGVYALGEGGTPDAVDVEALQTTLGRSGDKVTSFQEGPLWVGKIDIGAFEAPAFLHDDGAWSLIATGCPIFEPNGRDARQRDEDLVALRDVWPSEGAGTFARCQGTFSLCAFERGTGAMMLVTDKVGARPMYFAVSGEALYFATAMTLLEAVPSLDLAMDMRGVTEEALLGFPLADRTHYAPIRVLRGGEVLTAQAGEWDRSHYSHWGKVSQRSSLPRDERARAAYDAFLDAVACRVPRHGTPNSFLSGGLDARVVAGGLVALGHPVRSLTYEYPGRLDGPLARKVATMIGTDHEPVPVPFGARQRLLKATAARFLTKKEAASAAIYSGDGGSVGLGYVYLDAKMVEALRAGRVADALRAHLVGKELPRKIFQPSAFQRMAPLLSEGIEAELAAAKSGDPGRDFHIYLMDNDQRRHLHTIFEELDSTRTEFLLPFFDGRFLELVMSGPVDEYLDHDFYYQWLKHFPSPGVRDVPWQAYPGHLPCPLPLSEDEGRDQWQTSKADRFAASNPVYQRCRKRLFDRFPVEVLNRPSVLVAMTLHAMKLRDFSYVWNVVDTLQTVYTRCGGRLHW